MTVDFPAYLRLLTLALFLLGFIPELIHFFQAHILQISALLKGMIFHIIEATDKLLVRLFEGIVRIEFIETGSIDDREEEISQFLGRLFLVFPSQFHLEFLQFFLHLIPYILLSFQSKPTLRALS